VARPRRVALFAILVALALGLLAAFRRGPRRPREGKSAPAGGLSLPADGALVEEGRRYPVGTWSFSLARYEMAIEDTGMTTALDKVLERTHAELVVNGGFFDPEGKPVGLAVSDGAVISKLVKSLSGGVLVSDGARASVFATESFSLADAGVTFAVQCRPRLVVDGQPNVKSDDGKRAERTALCVRDDGRTVAVYVVRGSDDGESPGPSLFALAQHLTREGCAAALNLDGGPSTGAAYREGDRAVLLAPRNPVRHVIAFRERR
jgi:uncharacterized protein YigE (DUF2233 family)